ncbi:MAG: NAD(P)-binding domain-containing protein [Parvularculaceae bacterium]|nr:NAD(P)-binding domain-containing protein [Parvularculaceae bacterium]
MKIVIVGAGSVGRALGAVWHRAGHEIVWGVRDPQDEKYADLPGGQLEAIGDNLSKSDLIVMAVPWDAVDSVASALGADYSGILVDCTNPIAADFSGLDHKGAASGAEYAKALLPKARIVKAFNQTGAGNMANADYPNAQVANFVCSSDDNAASVVKQLSEDLGFDTVVVRGLEHSRQLEEMAWLWISLAIKQEHGADWAFSLVRR